MRQRALNAVSDQSYERLAESMKPNRGLPVTMAAALRLYERYAASSLMDARAIRILSRHANRLERFSRASRPGARAQVHASKDREIINRNAARLNREAKDVLSYQIEL